MNRIVISLVSLIVTLLMATAGTAQDIVDLLAQKKIEAKTEGGGIESLQVKVRRLVNQNVVVRIPVGTFFVSNNQSAQNMVTTAERAVTLQNTQWTTIIVPVACANLSRDVPGSGDSFGIQKSPHQEELQRLMPVLRKAGVGYAVQQAAVWIITDDATYDSLGILVSGFGGFGPRVIQEREAASAMRIIDQAGIDVRSKAIWRDLEKIVAGLKDESLKRWIGQKATQ